MTLKILVIEDDAQILDIYRSALRSHELTEISYSHEIYSHNPKDFDLAFIDFNIESDDLNTASDLKGKNHNLFTVAMTDIPGLEDDSLDVIIQRNSKHLEDDITDALEKAEEEKMIMTSGAEHIDFWHPEIIRQIDAAMKKSKLRPAVRTSESKWVADYSNALCSQLHELKRDYSPERHCIVHSCMAFSRIAGFALVKNDRDLYDDYDESFGDRLPDYSAIDTKETAKTLLEASMGNNIYRFVIKFSSRLDYEVGLRLTNLSTKKLGCRVADRAIAFACLSLYWINNQKTLQYQNGSAFRTYDQLMERFGKAKEFS